MKVNRTLQKLINKAVQNSFNDSGVKSEVVKKYITAFKKLNLSESIQALTLYSRGLKRILEEHTLFIESAGEMTKQQLDGVKSLFSKNYKLYTINSQFNPSLLGGLKVKIGDSIFDYSIKGKIKQVKEVIAG